MCAASTMKRSNRSFLTGLLLALQQQPSIVVWRSCELFLHEQHGPIGAKMAGHG